MTPTAFDWAQPYASARQPVFGRNVVATSHPLAAQAGLRMLQAGGNAVDAAIATAAAMTIVEPVSNGLGSDAFCILWDGNELHGLNASGPAPAAWTPEYFRRRHGADARTPPMRGWDTVTVPGAVAGWVALSRALRPPALRRPAAAGDRDRRARLPGAGDRAAQVGRRGAAARRPARLRRGLPARGRAPRVGELFRFEAAARTLRSSPRRAARPSTAARSPPPPRRTRARMAAR